LIDFELPEAESDRLAEFGASFIRLPGKILSDIGTNTLRFGGRCTPINTPREKRAKVAKVEISAK
jgi:hypothetical protein